jgi:hypothetical protein
MQLTEYKGFLLNKQSRRMALAACLAFLFVAVIAFMVQPAQAQYGASMQGTVADAQGAMIPGAHVAITEKDTGLSHETTTDSAGNFFFGGLAPSVYKVQVSRDGFQSKVIDNLKVIADQSNGLNVKLAVGGTTTTVTVNAADMPLIDTETGNMGGTITQQEIAKMPSFGRDVFQLVQLAPGMFGDGAQSGGGGSFSLPSSNSGAPGQTDGIFKTENQPQTSAAGGRTNTNAISIDGVAVTSVTWGGAAVITPNEDTVKEFKVVSNPYDAEEGRTSGASIKITSQNGTNSYHGSAFFKRDTPGLNAYQRWAPYNSVVRDTARFNQIGGTVGGPIIRNHLFAFFGYETIRNSSTGTGFGWYETSAVDGFGPSGSISNQLLTIKGAAPVYKTNVSAGSNAPTCASVNLVQDYNCNQIQGQGLAVGTPLATGLGTRDPAYFGQVPGPGGNAFYAAGLGGSGATIVDPWNASYMIADPGVGGVNLGSASLMYLETTNPTSNINVQYNGRVDWQATSKDLIAVSAYYTPVTNTSYNGPNRGYNFFHHNAKNYSFGALLDHTFSPNIITQLRADYAGWLWNEIKDNSQMPYGLPDDGINGQWQNVPGGVQLNNGNLYGNVYGKATPNNGNGGFWGPQVGSVFDQWTLNFKDVTTWAHKTHNIKFGGNVTRLAYLDLPTWDGGIVPSYTFNNMWDFVNDAPYTESMNFNPLTGVPEAYRKDDRQMVYGFFAQDDWKVKPNLTVNLGLRWEYFPGMFEKSGKLSDVRLGATDATQLTDAFMQLGGNQFDVPKTNFGPQIGFAWSPKQFSNRLVVHGGFGIGFDGLEQAITTNNRNNPPFSGYSPNLYPQDVASAAGNTSYLLYEAASSPYAFEAFPANTSVIISAFNSAGFLPGVSNNLTGFPSHMPTAMVYRYSLDGQYDLGHQWVATLGYQGSMGRHLPLQINYMNMIAPKLISGEVAPNPLFSSIDWYYDGGSSNFNALLAEAKHQMSHGVELDFQYRWSKSLDNGSNPYAEPDYQFLPGYNKGPSDFDSRNMFKVYGLWAPTIFKHNNMLEKVLGNWTFSGILNAHSGFPYDPTYGGIACNAVYPGSGDCNQRAGAYLSGAGHSQSTDTWKWSGSAPKGGNFTKGPSAYFTPPTVINNPGSWNYAGTGPSAGFTPLPQVPGIGRNAFVGPHYFDTDFTITKGFVLPKMKVLGEGARFEIRANAYNLFNTLNLANGGIDTNISDANFGKFTNGGNVLGSRMIELEGHFKF